METDEAKLYGRLFKAKIGTVVGLLLGLLISRPLWFSWSREIPRAPLVPGISPAAGPWLELVLSGLLLLMIIGFFVYRANRFLGAVAILLVLLAVLDQTRMQPWVYEYWLLFLVFALGSSDSPNQGKDRRTLVLAQLIVAALYFWSGAQKLNYTFIHETLPNLLGPAQNVLGYRLPTTAIALGIATAEIFTGVALHFRQTRKVAAVIAIAMHLGVLALLISRGYNHVVWAWNLILILLNVILFWNCEVFVGTIARGWRVLDLRSRLAFALVLASILLPALSFAGWWDMYLSGALYSGNTPIAVIQTDPTMLEKLTPSARASVFTTGPGETVLPLQEWSLRELRVPPYPQMRVYQQIAQQVCPHSGDPQQTGLIVRGRPGIWNGSYEVIRIPCGTLLR